MSGPGPYYATGAHLSVAAGRVAFTLGEDLWGFTFEDMRFR